MAQGKLALYNLGTQGVDLTRSVIHAEDGTWRRLQNAVPDPRGEFGGVGKRDGLIAINSSTAGGTITGVIDVPLPAVTTRTFLFGRTLSTNQDWGTSTDAFATSTTNTNLTDVVDFQYFNIAGPFNGEGFELMGRVGWNGKFLVYPPDGYTQSTVGSVGGEAPSLRIWDGTTDRELCRVPYNAFVKENFTSSGHAYLIFDIILDGDYCYFTTFDYDNGVATAYGRVFRCNMKTAELIQVGETFGGVVGGSAGNTSVPLCLCVAQGFLWCGTGAGNSTGASIAGKVYRIRPGVDTGWTLDATFDADECPISICTYRGRMYAGLFAQTAAVGQIMQRSTAGAWSVLSDSGGAPSAKGSRCTSLTVFGDNLYWNDNNMQGASSTARIRKYTDSAVSTVYTYTLETGNENQLGLCGIVHNSKIYMVSNVSNNLGTAALGRVAHSSDGTTWSHNAANEVLEITGRIGVVVT